MIVASNLAAMASTLLEMASDILSSLLTSDGLQPSKKFATGKKDAKGLGFSGLQED